MKNCLEFSNVNELVKDSNDHVEKVQSIENVREFNYNLKDRNVKSKQRSKKGSFPC